MYWACSAKYNDGCCHSKYDGKSIWYPSAVYWGVLSKKNCENGEGIALLSNGFLQWTGF